MMHVDITTFGYGHDAPPLAHLTFDLRDHFRDPHVRRDLRYKTARDAEVRAVVLGTPGIRALIEAIAAAVLAYQAGPSGGRVAVAIGCAGGRHRAATVGRALAAALADRQRGPVTLTHRDLGKDVISR